MATTTDRDDAIGSDIGRQPVRRELTGGENRDAITDAPGSHPIGTGVGAATAGAAGAIAGSVIPGIGTVIGGVVGTVVGAVAGGLAGKAVAESVNPTDEHAYWRDEYRNRDYYKPGYDYDADYGPAYSSAIDAYNTDPARPFESVEGELEQNWQTRRGSSRLDWQGAKSAMRDVYARTRQRQAEASGDGVDRM